MRALLILGSLAVGALYLFYESYRAREQQYSENQHTSGQGGRFYLSETDEIEVGPSSITRNSNITTPDSSDICSVCLDPLLLKTTTRRYCIISLPGCGHWFHQKCAFRLVEYHPQCPVCRSPIDKDMLRSRPVRLNENAQPSETLDSM